MDNVSRQAAIEALRSQENAYLSPEYATGQPASSAIERLVVQGCIAALSALPAVEGWFPIDGNPPRNVWLPIETAPTDGTRVYLKRVYDGKIVTKGWGVFSVMADDAPMRQSDEFFVADNEYADTPRWLRPDRRHTFPAPTHYRPTD